MEANILRVFESADMEGRIEIIIKNYPSFMDIVDCYTEDMVMQIIDEQNFNRRQNIGNLGVRVQTSGTSDPTFRQAVRNVDLRQAIIDNCLMENDLADTDHEEIFLKDAGTLYEMRSEYTRFTRRIKTLKPGEVKLFLPYIMKEKDLTTLADECGIQYESVGQKIRRIKNMLIRQMESYNQATA